VDDDRERESGDGQEELESENGSKKKVDHDEDRSNPQYIPKKGTFYEHDDRTVEDINADEALETPEVNDKNSQEGLSVAGKVLTTQNQKVPLKKTKDADRWTHDRFNEYEQAPKSRSELVSAYGYDIRSEDGPPRPRRQRRYGRHQSKYSRNWEDEEAYKKSQIAKPTPRRSLRAEDFPALGSTTTKSPRPKERSEKTSLRIRSHQDENDPKPFSSPERRREPRGQRDEQRASRDQRNQRYNNDTSNNNNARNVKGKKNINFNHNIEFKNQNRKNINYETTQTKNNNVLNQQMQSSHVHNQTTSTSQMHSQSHQSHASGGAHQQRFNNSEAPLPTLSFTNSKMNNTTNSAGGVASQNSSSRGILNFDNTSGNYGRVSGSNREKELNSQSLQQAQALSPNKNNIQQQYGDHQMDQMKFIEKSYSQQQGKATNLNLNQVHQSQHQPLNNNNSMPHDSAITSGADMSRSKRYSSLRQRSNINETSTSTNLQQQASPSQHFHPQYHQQDIEPALVQITPQQNPSPYIAQQQTTQPSSNVLTASTPQQPPTAASQQAPKYQAAYYATNAASEYALMQAAMVEKYQYQQQPTPAQYIPPQPVTLKMHIKKFR
jgi:protein CASC3